MVLIRLVMAESLCSNVRVFAKHIGMKDNGKADALSRLDWKRFWNLADDTMNAAPTEIPDEIWPLGKIWKN